MATPTAGMPLPLLLRFAGETGWTLLGLERRHGTVLRALADVLPQHSAAGSATVDQVADRTGFCRRWVSTALRELEDAGVLIWRRGRVEEGRPVPSWFRVAKGRLVELWEAARDAVARRTQGRRDALANRLARRGSTSLRSNRRRKGPDQAEKPVSAGQSMWNSVPPSTPNGGGRGAAEGPRAPRKSSTADRSWFDTVNEYRQQAVSATSGAAMCRAALGRSR